MVAWATHGKWITKLKWVKQLQTSSRPTVSEVKGFQERLLFIRCGGDAVAIDGFVKKDDWSKKDRNVLEAAVRLVEAAAAECPGGRPR
jgi:hypothetical protein